MSLRLRRAFELEHPAAQLDNFVVEFFVRMLEDDAEDVEELAEAWSPFLLEHAASFDNDSATRDVCRAVLRRMRSADMHSDASTPPLLSRQSSASMSSPSASASTAAALTGAGGGGAGCIRSASSGATAEDEPHCGNCAATNGGAAPSGASGIEVWGLMEWLRRLSLVHYAPAARAWCAELGAADVEEVIENFEEFCNELKLKPLERRRVRRECCPEADGPGGPSSLCLASAASGAGPRVVGNGASAAPVSRVSASSAGASASAAGPQAPLASPSPTLPLAGAAASLALHEGLALSASPSGGGGGLDAAGAPLRAARPHRCERFGPASRPYTIVHEIGAGTSATVYRCTRGEETLAAKAITLSRFRMLRDFATEVEKLHRESEILYTLRHPKIVSLFDVVETPEKLYLVMELVEGGDLFEHICQNGKLAEHESRYVFLQIAIGLRYIHAKGVVHRDLKPQNILIDRQASRPGLLEVKISDFGHSKLVNDGYDMARTQVGTPRYWAPEVAERSGLAYDQRVDLWSLGVLLYVMLEGRYPFDGCDEAIEVLFSDQIKLSQDAQDLVKRLIQLRPSERLPIEKCLAHPWVMLKSGLLSRVIALSEDQLRRGRGDCERRALLPRDPKDVQGLRRELQALTLRFRLPARLRKREVAVCFGSAAAEEAVDAAWEALLIVLKKHFPGETCQRLDISMPKAWELGEVAAMGGPGPLPPVQESGAGEEEASPHPASAPSPALDAHDAELLELLAASGAHTAARQAFAAAHYGGHYLGHGAHRAHASASASGLGAGGLGGAWKATALVGEWAPVPRRANFRLRDGGHVLEVGVQLPEDYPARRPPELASIELRRSGAGVGRRRRHHGEAGAAGQEGAAAEEDGDQEEDDEAGEESPLPERGAGGASGSTNGASGASAASGAAAAREPAGGGGVPVAEGGDPEAAARAAEALRGLVEPYLAAQEGPCLVDFLSWLRQKPAFAAALRAFAASSSAGLGGDAAAGLGADAVGAAEVRCARVCLINHHHNDKVDMHGMCTTKGQPLKRASFYGHLRSSCSEVSGFLSFGKPGVLLAEGPLGAVEKLLAEVERFPSWWTAQEKVFQRTKAADPVVWRVFKEFSKVRTEELRELFDSVERPDLFEEAMAGTAMDPKRKAAKGRHR